MSDIFSNVLYVGPLNTFGGIGAVLRTYEKNITDFNFIATHKDHSKIGSSFYFIYSLFHLNGLLLFNRKIKIVHIHSASKGSFIRKIIVVLFSKIHQKKIIFHMHGGQFKEYHKKLTWEKSVYSSILKEVDLFICLTEEWKSYFQENLGLQNVLVLGNPVKIDNVIKHKSYNQVISLLFLGSLNAKKGIFDFLNYIYTNSYFKNKQIKLTVGGTGEVDKLTNMIKRTEFLDQINYIGFVSEQKKIDAILDCDIFILPSYYEGLPVSILEAMGYGKPIIATRVGGVPSVVKEQKNGWLFDAGNFNQLDAIFDEILNHRFPLHQYQTNAYEMASGFSTENIIMDLSNHYEKLINE